MTEQPAVPAQRAPEARSPQPRPLTATALAAPDDDTFWADLIVSTVADEHTDHASGGCTTPGDVVVWVQGELDVAAAPYLRAFLEGSYLQGSVDDRLVLDLSGVTFVDLAGMDPLLEAGRRFEREGRSMVLREVSPAVELLLRAMAAIDHPSWSPERRRQALRIVPDQPAPTWPPRILGL